MRNIREFDISSITHFGIWKEKGYGEDIIFVKDPAMFDRHSYWANTPKIPKKKKSLRCVLFGDSVAMGEYFQPEITPSKLLEEMIRGVTKDGQGEVIDLTCNHMDIDSFMEFCLSALVTEPDAIIVYMGGGFIPSVPRGRILSQYKVNAIKENDIEAMDAGMVSKELENRLIDLLRYFSDIDKYLAIPVIFLLPAPDWEDWSREFFYFPAFAGWGCNAGWHDAQKKIDAAVKTGDIKTTLTCALETVRLYPHPYFYDVAGRCCNKLGMYHDATEYFTLADNLMGEATDMLPLSTPFLRNTLLKYAGDYRVKIVDLQSAFCRKRYFGIGGIKLYMDHCHLTVKGMIEAMRLTARKCLESLGYTNIVLGEPLSGEFLKNSAQTMGKAYLLAAVASAQREPQLFGLLRHHCRKALKYWPETENIMKLYIELATNKSPRFLHKNITSLAKVNFWAAFPDRSQLMGPISMENKLVDEMVAAVKNLDSDKASLTQLEKKVNVMRRKGFGISDIPVNLLEPYYYNYTDYLKFLKNMPEKAPRPVFYCAYDTQSVFWFYTDLQYDLELSVTIMCAPFGNRAADILINGTMHISLPLSSDWQSYQVRVPGELLNSPEINTITFVWSTENENEWPDISEELAYVPIYGYISRLKVMMLTG